MLKEKKRLERIKKLVAKNKWILDCYKEFDKEETRHYKKLNKIEKKYEKICKKELGLSFWFAFVFGEDPFGIDIGNAQSKGDTDHSFLIHFSDLDRYLEKKKKLSIHQR